jgi:hypothetical protein
MMEYLKAIEFGMHPDASVLATLSSSSPPITFLFSYLFPKRAYYWVISNNISPLFLLSLLLLTPHTQFYVYRNLSKSLSHFTRVRL